MTTNPHSRSHREGRLAGRTALITGAGLGIGRACAIRFAEEGARLVLTDIDPVRLAETRALLTPGCEALVHPADVTDETQVAELFAHADAFGPVEILVNNVGGGRPGRIWDLSVEDWDHTMRLSLRSMFLCTRAILPGMIERGYGRIACLSSGARNGTVWNALHMGACAYSTAKAGVTGFVRDLAIELADSGVTINAVAPGPIDTELAGPFLRAMEEQSLDYSPFRMVPMRRLGTPREVADALLYVCSQEASYVTGTTLDVSGGR
ncbi:SDR family NAD(P)-dependent oxidoreductase [Novosphingobium sp. P6W]|uniref:SDR family NAD(P)-dependent oxidoreductase n=1 Tax=Novosphingobium sp. P6W TaxID=1609758 RepID=UPI0005C2CC76|nr:SDR family NAD(P)-dependent oxidoreductase [Novosphingobium sp. P6W]AXB79421.1 SDR family NAD(P)-dependent oxidoreductase [Novosphingobium sp. P6W]KIS34186.1 SDR-family protein [Novosphingobium sp. P6W]